MSSIKTKNGTCIDCPPNTPAQPIIAKRCLNGPHYHYKNHNAKRYQENSIKNKQAKAASVANSNGKVYPIGKWFNDQISMMPRECENCGVYLNPNAPWSSRAYIAHIVPKRHFISVMVHPLNRVFLCIDCHTKFDNSLSVEIIKMPVYTLAVSRFNIFKSLILDDEIKHLAPCFFDIF